ncbi:transposase, partial [Escherichia coli]|nr:transposase [Escherichia coli]
WSTSKTPSYTKSVSWQHHLHFISSAVSTAITGDGNCVVFRPSI